MDLRQHKLTKREWEILEIPVDSQEMKILNLINKGWDNVNIKFNDTNSLLNFMKITSELEIFHQYFYELYFMKIINELNKKFEITFNPKRNKKKKQIKKGDLIRIKNISSKLNDIQNNIFEFVLLTNVKIFLKSGNHKEYYTLTQLVKKNITNINIIVLNYVNYILKKYEKKMKKDIFNLIKHAEMNIEKNNDLKKYSDIELYRHQKELFTFAKNKGNKLILYQAPTGMGKTLSPIGLVKGQKIIFMCAAKHVGLQLAKSCISMEIPIAIAFGCNDISDIRLHFFAAKEYVKHRKSGQIFRVDNSVGDKVEMIICDIQSYLYAMRYMTAFNEVDDILWYWDEPTITLDYENHDFHEILQRNWRENEISNVVLCSATLPKKEELVPMLTNFVLKFSGANIYTIKNYDCVKTISLIDSGGEVIMPHLIADNNKKKLKKMYKFIDNNKTLLRHVDVVEMSNYICYLNKHNLISERYKMENYFEKISDIDLISIKLYYLRLLKVVNEFETERWEEYKKKIKKKYNSVIKITTSDSYTLTDGPTIFLTENVEKLALFYLKASNIERGEMNNILKFMEDNEVYRTELDKIMDEERQRIEKQGEKDKDKDRGINSTEFRIIEEYNQKVTYLKSMMKKVQLKELYIPNKKKHMENWHNCHMINKIKGERIDRMFTSDISEEVVERIMLIDVKMEWKILLLMGIGVFIEHSNKEYSDIMKALAQEQKLYLILASSDFIYGTNYQFCHGYLGKDLNNMTQEKMLQAFGRVGRKNNQSEYTLRLRDASLIDKLYKEEEDKMEVLNMNRLFG